MWNNTQTTGSSNDNMGVQTMSANMTTTTKRPKEDDCFDDAYDDDDDVSPTKMARTEAEQIVQSWQEEYYPAGKCYQCFPTAEYQASATPEAANNWGSVTPQNQQQTIKRDENGKSYLDLGSGTCPSAAANQRGGTNVRTCNAKNKWCWCGPSCYRQRRLTALNISMCKLGRYRQFTEPSLRRSVLICNTLRYIEREMEMEGCFNSRQEYNSPPPEVVYQPVRAQTPYPSRDYPSSDDEDMYDDDDDDDSDLDDQITTTATTTVAADDCSDDGDSAIGSDHGRSINWGSVLSLSSQSDLDPSNNNDSLCELEQFSRRMEADLTAGYSGGPLKRSLSLPPLSPPTDTGQQLPKCCPTPVYQTI